MVPIHCFDSTYPKSSIYLIAFCIVPILTPSLYAKSALEGNMSFSWILLLSSAVFMYSISHFAIVTDFDSDIFFKSGKSVSISETDMVENSDFFGYI